MTQASEVSGRIVFGAWALLLALAAVPIFSTVLPPLADYPNHLARFYLLAQGGNDYYAVRWAPLPNLAGDVIVPALAQAMPLGLAAKVFLVTTFALLTGGTLWLSRVTSGGWRLWPLMSFLLLYNREFLLGFLNYLFALGVALCGTALWLAVERRPSGERMAISSVMALICFFCHISGFAIYAIAIAGLEAMPAWAECRLHRWRELAWRCVVTGAQFLIPASIIVISWRPPIRGSYEWFWEKAYLFLSVLDNYNLPFDIACIVAILGLLGCLVWQRQLRLALRFRPVLALLAVAYFALPTYLATGWAADERFSLAFVFMLFGLTTVRFYRTRTAAITAAALAVIFVARFAVIERLWLTSDRVYTEDLAKLDRLPMGCRVAIAYSVEGTKIHRIQQWHLGALAVERRACWTGRCEAYRWGEVKGPLHEWDFELAYLRVEAVTSLPAFAIGGISAENISAVVPAGATRIAVSGAVWKADDPRLAVTTLGIDAPHLSEREHLVDDARSGKPGHRSENEDRRALELHPLRMGGKVGEGGGVD